MKLLVMPKARPVVKVENVAVKKINPLNLVVRVEGHDPLYGDLLALHMPREEVTVWFPEGAEKFPLDLVSIELIETVQ